jgi:hypothetical protein
MTTLVIRENNLQSKQILDYARTRSSVTAVEKKKSSEELQQAVKACQGVTVDAFFDELDSRLKQHYQNA